MRQKLVAGNWKMNLTKVEAFDLLLQLNRFVITHSKKSEVIIAPSYLYLNKAVDTFHNNKIKVASQDISANEDGAFTGEISANMLRSVGVRYTIIGHSEKRQFHYETEETLKQKINQALKNKIIPIFCCGESLNQRNLGITLQVINSQIKNSLFQLSEEDFSKIIIAYEPVWAIGTGEVATPNQAQEVHEYIRNMVLENYGGEIADNLSIIYGGSLNPNNAKDIFMQEDIDGGLIGGASLKSSDFTKIITELDKTF